jgi:O-methyltransferase
MKLFIIRYTKIILVFFRIDILLGFLSSFFSNIYYTIKLSAWINKNKKVVQNDFPSKWDYQKRYPLYLRILQQEHLTDTRLDYFEFGVADGESFRWFLKQNSNPESCFYGFDTFTGLPEDFGVYKKGMFNTNNKAPETNDTRAYFLQGLFQKTLPQFLKSFTSNNRKVIMLDADLYSATLFVLSSLAPILKKDDIVFFDQFSVPTHEFKAFHEFQHSYPHINLQLIGASNNFYFAAFKVI